MTVIALASSRFRFHGSSVPSKIATHATGAVPKGREEVVGAAVAKVTITVFAAPLSCTAELDKLQVGAGAATGVMPQVRVTIPVKDPAGVTGRLNCAFFPALMVCDPPGEDGPRVKSGAATPIPESAIFCGLPGSVSLIARLAILDPPLVGLNVTLAMQLAAGANATPQLLLCVKSELSAPPMLIPVMVSPEFPVFTRRTEAGLLLVPTARAAKAALPGWAVSAGPLTPLQ
jgi:hypothetical protein